MDGPSSAKVKKYFRDLKCITQNTSCVVLLCFAFCLPLASGFIMEFTSIWSTASVRTTKILIAIGLLSENWFKYGTILSGLCLVIIIWINAIAAKDHIKIKYITKFTAIAIATFVLFSCIMLIPPYWISEGDTVKTYSGFVTYMQRIPATMSDGKVQLRTRDENFIERLYADDGTFLCEYKPFNEDVEHIKYGNNQMLPITIYTKQHYDEVRKILKSIKNLWTVVVLIEGICTLVFYEKKKIIKNNLE